MTDVFKTCSACGHVNRVEFNFCQRCNGAFPKPPPYSRQTIALVAGGTALLVVLAGLIAYSAAIKERRDKREADLAALAQKPRAEPLPEPRGTLAMPVKPNESPEVAQSTLPSDPASIRGRMTHEWEVLVQASNPQLNYISATTVKIKGGYALYAEHEFFNRYQLSIGDDAHVAEDFIRTYPAALKSAGITRVGYRGRGEYASWCYLEVP